VFIIIETLWQEGIRVKCDNALNRLLKMAEETDYVNIAPSLAKLQCYSYKKTL